MQETWVQPLGWKDPLEEGKATTPVFWPGDFHGLYSPWDRKELDMTERLSHVALWWVLGSLTAGGEHYVDHGGQLLGPLEDPTGTPLRPPVSFSSCSSARGTLVTAVLRRRKLRL